MIKKILYTLLILFTISCTQTIDNKEIIRKITNDNLTVKRVDIIQVSKYNNIITDINNSVKSSKEAWKNAPELNQLHRLIIIDEVSNKFLKKLNEINYLNDDEVIAYRFVKKDKSKEFIGYAVLIFHENNQKTLFYEIKASPYDFYPSGGIKQLINKGLLEDINKIESEYNKNQYLKKNNP